MKLSRKSSTCGAFQSEADCSAGRYVRSHWTSGGMFRLHPALEPATARSGMTTGTSPGSSVSGRAEPASRWTSQWTKVVLPAPGAPSRITARSDERKSTNRRAAGRPPATCRRARRTAGRNRNLSRSAATRPPDRSSAPAGNRASSPFPRNNVAKSSVSASLSSGFSSGSTMRRCNPRASFNLPKTALSAELLRGRRPDNEEQPPRGKGSRRVPFEPKIQLLPDPADGSLPARKGVVLEQQHAAEHSLARRLETGRR